MQLKKWSLREDDVDRYREPVKGGRGGTGFLSG